MTLAAMTDRFEAALAAEADGWRWPAPLGEAARHALFGGGKRVRPVLAMMGAQAVGGSSADALPWAMAIEMVHTYSLIHDDLPAMDDDDERRGRPTVHIAFDEAIAVLAGDALLTDAFRVLAGAPQGPKLVGSLAEWAGGRGMIGGQVLDIAGVKSLDDLVLMQRLKTAALIRIAVAGGAVAAEGSVKQIEALAAYGEALGLLFQVTDDVLDRAQDAERDGNNYFHHLSDAEVYARRDQLAAESIEALAGFGEAADSLRVFAERIAKRTV